MIREYNIAIVGFGVGGIAALTQILDDKFITGCCPTIVIFDINPIADSNICANSTEDLYLNTSASLNSLLADNPDHFYNWVLNTQHKWKEEFPQISQIEPETFLPRKLYFYYMEDLFSSYLKKAKEAHIYIEIVNSYIKKINPVQDGFILETEEGNLYSAKQVISSIGNGNCTDRYSYLRNLPGYIERPCVPSERYKEITDNQLVLILGSMLSAVDALLLILKRNLGKITLASPSGVFPAVRSAYVDNVENYKELSAFNDVNVLLKYFHDKVNASYYEDKDKTNINYKSKDDSWCHYVAPFLNKLNDLWERASDEEKVRYTKAYELQGTKRFLSAIPNIIAERIVPSFIRQEVNLESNLRQVDYDTKLKKYTAVYSNGKPQYFDACINASAATDNSKNELYLSRFYNTPNFYIIGDSNKRNFINNGVFLFVREVQKRIIPNMRKTCLSLNNKIMEKELDHVYKV